MEPITDQYQKVRDISFVGQDLEDYLNGLLGPEFEAYRKRWHAAEKCFEKQEFPLFLVLETINACNLSCEMCFRRHGSTAPVKRMSDELFSRIMTEAAAHGCPSLSLNANNEPLLDRRLPAMVQQAREAGFIDIRINTNAMLLNADMAEALIRAGLTRLSVSLDAARPETYARLRRGGDFDLVTKSVSQFLEIRKRLGQRLPVLRCTFVVTPENEEEVVEFERRWEGIADYVSFQRYVPHTSDESALRLGAELPQHAGLTCSQPFERLLVDTEGTVYPCCSPQGAKLNLGSLGKETLKQIWDGPREELLRLHMSDMTWRQLAPCRLCLTGNLN